MPGGCQKLEEGWKACKRGMKGGMGDGRRYRFEDAGAGADDICTAKFFRSNVEHTLQVLPVSNVCVLENGSGWGLGEACMLGNGFLGFRAEGEIGEDDVAAFAEEGFGECEINA